MSDIIPDDIEQFILHHISSIAQMEALLMLSTDARKEWDIVALARALFITEQDATVLCEQLVQLGFVLRLENGCYAYAPASVAAGEMIARVTEHYRRYLIPVTNLIHSKMRIQEFADAFKLRKD